MSEVAGPQASKDVVGDDGPSGTPVLEQDQATTDLIKAEDAAIATASTVPTGSDRPAASANEIDADGDSEAETLIQSPEKKRNIVGSAPVLQPKKNANVREDDSIVMPIAFDAENKSRKRKRAPNDAAHDGSSRVSSPPSSPLSSPNLHPHSRDSDSETSTRSGRQASKNARPRRHAAPKAESDDAEERSAPSKIHRRRPSDLLPPSLKYRAKGQRGSIDAGASERRETRSATYPRHSSEERSPSPRPISSRKEHRRGVSTQLTSGEFQRKKRGRPPLINTRRNRSADRAVSDSSDGSSSPPPSRPDLPKLSSHDQDNMSPAKVTGPRKWRDKNGRTFLSRACNNDDLETAKARLAERPEDINLPDNAGNTPLQIAALEGFVDIVQFLLQNNAEVDTRNIDKETPLIDAVENGHLEVVRLLLEFGANPRLGNAKGDEPYELVPADDENYKIIRKLLADAKEHEVVKRRRSNDNNETHRDGGSSRAASAASPRDSPGPIIGPRSPPATAASRRRTGRSESTRNDLLWQANTQENLTRLAGKGDVQGVASILTILEKAQTESLIAAAKAGHEEVLQYLLAMGDADPDPDPVHTIKPGFNTPMLAAIGRSNPDVIKLLVEQSGFNPTKKFRGKTYFEIASDRKGDGWQKEFDILKVAYEKHTPGKVRKTTSPRKTREQEKPRVRQPQRSTSPVSSNLRHSTSPTLTHKSLPNKSPESLHKEKRREMSSPQAAEHRKMGAVRKDAGDSSSVAVSSDHDQTVAAARKGHKLKRSQSDLLLPPNLEAEITHRRRRLVTGKEHRRRKSNIAGVISSDNDQSTEIEVKHDSNSPGMKRTRSSQSPDRGLKRDSDPARSTIKKRRTVLESSPDETRPGPRKRALRLTSGEVDGDVEMKDTEAKMLTDVDEVFRQHKRTRSEQAAVNRQARPISEVTAFPQEPPRETETESIPPPKAPTIKPEHALPPSVLEPEVGPAVMSDADREQQEREEAEKVAKAAEESRRREEERLAAEMAAAEQRLAEEAEAKRKAEEEAMAKKKEDEERQERMRRELEDRQRRQEEQIRLQHLEIERRRREALPATLCRSALMLDSGDLSYKTPHWLSKFLPLYTVRTRQLDPNCPPVNAEEEWIPNFQVACLLATKDLNLRNYTSLEKRAVTPMERDRIWKVARHMLSYEYESTSVNTSIRQAVQKEEEERPKFFAMDELFWVKLSDFDDQVFRHPHLFGMLLKKQPISLRIIDLMSTTMQPEANGVSPKMTNGVSPYMSNGVYGSGQPRL